MLTRSEPQQLYPARRVGPHIWKSIYLGIPCWVVAMSWGTCGFRTRAQARAYAKSHK